MPRAKHADAPKPLRDLLHALGYRTLTTVVGPETCEWLDADGTSLVVWQPRAQPPWLVLADLGDDVVIRMGFAEPDHVHDFLDLIDPASP